MKIAIIGPGDHIFSRILLEQEDLTVRVCDDFELANFLPDRIVMINQSEKEAVRIAANFGQALVFQVHGGEKDFQPNLILISADFNHQYFLFESFDEFIMQIKSPEIDALPLVSALIEPDCFQLNYQHFPELARRYQTNLDKKFFWWSVFYTKIYYWWFSRWLDDVMGQNFPINLSLGDKGSVRKIAFAFSNRYQGEMIFREGETIKVGIDVFVDTAIVLNADEDSLEIVFSKDIPKCSILSKVIYISKDKSVLAAVINSYKNVCANFSDLSDKDYIYQSPHHYNRPEDFLRGYTANFNKLHLPFKTVKLSATAKMILRDKSQLKAFLDILSPSFVTQVEGPPGTGKTKVSAIAIQQLVRVGQVVLVLSHSNQGLDNLIKEALNYLDPSIIFRLGNNPDSINANAVRKLHRGERYAGSTKASAKVNDVDLELKFENENIWRLICGGKGLVLACTVNSFQFDKQLQKLFSQKFAIGDKDNLPKAVAACLKQKIVPQFLISTTFIDEATKVRFGELVPILKHADAKLVFVGDTDQLGNLEISPEPAKEIKAKAQSFCHPGENLHNIMIVPEKLTKVDHALIPLKTTNSQLEYWFQNFSRGVFHSLLSAGNLDANHLEVNRRSLPNITKFLNYVFKKNLKVGRFNPHILGEVIFLDVSGLEKKFKTSYGNRKEKCLVVKELLKLYQHQKTISGKLDLTKAGVIATYSGQIKMIKGRLRKELLYHSLFDKKITPKNLDQVLGEIINTVDAFQGSERDSIIVSLVRANDSGAIGFSEDLARIYVALSRARNQLIIIGNSQTFLHSDDQQVRIVFGRILQYCQIAKNYGRK